MEEVKKQILLTSIANYNETVNNISKFKLNDKEINLFCEVMQIFAEKYHKEQLRIGGVQQSEQLCYCGNIASEKYSPCCSLDHWHNKFSY